MTRLSCHHFRSNEVRLWLSVLAYNLGNLWRRLVLPKRIENWSLTSLQQRLVKTGGRLIKHARYYWLLLAEGHLKRQRIEASKVIQGEQVSAARQVKSDKQGEQVSGTAKRAALATQLGQGAEVDTEGRLAYGFAER